MGPTRRWAAGLLACVAVAGCTSSHFEPLELQGRPTMVGDQGQPRLWVLSKQEEQRQVSFGGGNRRIGGWRTDTFFHFQLQAFDPSTARPLWSRRVLTLGDAEAHGSQSRVIGSSAAGRVLGQDGDLVWLLIDEKPLALSLSDGARVADTAAIEQRNPDLKGLLPVEAKHYGFDRGLVFMSADARRFVLRGHALKAEPYTQPEQARPAPLLKANGAPLIVPMLPMGEVPARQVRLEGQWLGLYSENEAADLVDDKWGNHLRWPYTVLNEGALARRAFWRAKIVEARSFEERFERFDSVAPVQGAPIFLKGRFLKDLASGEPLVLDDPAGVMVWHGTRIDRDGRLALTRLDNGLRESWTTELPLSETSTMNPVMYWMLPKRLLAMGELESQVDGVTRRVPHLVSVSIADGGMQAWDLQDGKAVP